MKLKKKLLSLLLAAALIFALIPMQAAAEELPFDDVAADSWYAGAVSYVYSQKLFSGTSEREFSPESPMTRAMFVQVLANKTQNYDGVLGGDSAFSDVPAGQWYADAVNWAAKMELVSGTGEGRFSPNDRVTREQMALFLYRYAKNTENDVNFDASNAETFPDYSMVSPWAQEAIGWAVSKGIIGGSDGKLNPRANAKRCEVAQVFRMADPVLEKNEVKDPNAPAPVPSYPGYEGVPDFSHFTETGTYQESDGMKIYAGHDSLALYEYKNFLKENGYTEEKGYAFDLRDYYVSHSGISVQVYSNSELHTSIHLIKAETGKQWGQPTGSREKVYGTIIKINSPFSEFEAVKGQSLAMIEFTRLVEGDEAVTGKFPNLDSNYRYGWCDSYHSILYMTKGKIENPVRLWFDFLKRKYNFLDTPVGRFRIEDLEVWGESTEGFTIHLDLHYSDASGTLLYPEIIASSSIITNQQKAQVAAAMQQLMRDIERDASDIFPNARIKGSVFSSSYTYPNLEIGFHSSQTMSWSNYSTDENGEVVHGFHFTPERDSYELNPEMFLEEN